MIFTPNKQFRIDSLFVPTENDFRKWILDAVKECLENTPPTKSPPTGEKEDLLISRKEIAQYLGISLVTLADWMNVERAR
jgi:hypothetical protein